MTSPAEAGVDARREPGGQRSYTFVPLFAEPWNGRSHERLRASVSPRSQAFVTCALPPLQGIAFLTATGHVSTVLDEWWLASITPGSVPVLLMMHEPELDTWVQGLDAVFVIGVPGEADLALYARHRNVAAALIRDGPAELTEYVIRLYGGDGAGCFRAAEPPAVTRRLVPAPSQPAPATRFAPWDPASGGQAPDPFHALVAARPVTSDAAGPQWTPADRPVDGRAGHAGQRPPTGTAFTGHRRPPPGRRAARAAAARGRGLSLRGVLGSAAGGLFRGGRRAPVPEELTRLALAHTQGKIVGVISRAGGVGKTAVAAALGIIYGEAVQDSGWCAAVLDQNTGNPDQWGRMQLSPSARTISQIMADIEAGHQWTIPAWNGTPALAVYPESRTVTEAYAPAQIERFASHLRQIHAVSVVDLPNRLPAFTTGEAALCAGWAVVADVLAIPTTDDPTRLQGVVELLDAPLIKGDARNGYRSIPVVVAYVSSPLRAIRQSRDVGAYLERIRERAVEVVEIPKDERATLAIIKGQPITEVDARLRSAYVQLALAVARTLAGE